MNPTDKIESIGTEDLLELAPLIAQFYTEISAFSPFRFHPHIVENYIAFLQKIPPSNFYGWRYLVDGEIGSILLGYTQKRIFYSPQNFFFVDIAFTQKKFRKKGLMKQLWKTAIDRLHAKGIRAVELFVLKDNLDAKALWEHLGCRLQSYRYFYRLEP